MVPLVFDDDGFLHSPHSFKALTDRLMAAQRGGRIVQEPEVLFTDLVTFRAALTGDPALEALYAASWRGRIPVQAAQQNGKASQNAQSSYHVEVFDPYVNPNPSIPPPPCDDFDPECNGGGGGGGGGGGVNWPYRPTHNAAPSYGSTPDWPKMWKGDVISGDTDNGKGSAGTGNLGHSSIVTVLDNNENQWGRGNFMNFGTMVMEAIGKEPNEEDEVLERAARTYWHDLGHEVKHVKVRFHKDAQWSERQHAVDYARGQDPDHYSALTPKWTQGAWYCSKLVWVAYDQATGDDLDPDWGYWVTPGDLEASGHLRSVYHFINSDNG